MISGCIRVMLDRKALDLRSQPLARSQPGIGPGHPLRAVFVACEGAQFLQLRNGAFGIKTHGRRLEMTGLTFQRLATPALANKLAVAHLNRASHSNDGRATFNLHAFETTIVVVHMM